MPAANRPVHGGDPEPPAAPAAVPAERGLAYIDTVPGYEGSFFGILNAAGDFWTPIAFEFERDEATYRDGRGLGDLSRSHRIVPVRIQLTQLPDDGGRP